MPKKVFIQITNKDIFDRMELLEKNNSVEHKEICEHLIQTNGKVKLNKWIGTTAISLVLIVIVALITVGLKTL